MPTIFRATHVSKDVQDDTYAGGCDPKTFKGILSDQINLFCDSLGGLIKRLADTYFLSDKPEDWLLRLDSDDRSLFWLEFNRLEDGESNPIEANSPEWHQFVAGEISAYLADYSFYCNAEEVEDHVITAADVSAAGCRCEDDL